MKGKEGRKRALFVFISFHVYVHVMAGWLDGLDVKSLSVRMP